MDKEVGMHLERVFFLWPLLFLGAISILLFLGKRRGDKAATILFGSSPKALLYSPQATLRVMIFRLGILLGSISLLFALFQPYSYSKNEVKEIKDVEGLKLTRSDGGRLTKEIIFLLDTSFSMSVKDTRQGLSRLDLAKDLIDEMSASFQGEEVTLYAFTSEVSKLVPPTYDYLYFRLMVKQVDLNAGDVAGTDLLQTFEYLKSQHFSQHPRQSRVLVLLTDGGDTRIEGLEGDARQREVNLLLSQIKAFQEEGVSLFIIGLGSKQGELIPGLSHEGRAVHSSLDEDLLGTLVRAIRGEYYAANDYSTLSIVNDIMSKVGQLQDKEVGGEGAYVEKKSLGSLHDEENKQYYHQLFTFLACLCLFCAYLLKKGE